MILVTGASGNVGRCVLQSVLQAGLPAKALYRSTADAASAPKGVEPVIADFADRDATRRALAGIDKLFLVCAPIPQLVELESNVVQAAEEAQVEHLVLNSALGAGAFPESFPAWHHKVEELLRGSGVPYTIIRPNSFMQNLAAFYAPTIRSQGQFYASMGAAPVSLIDVRDIADCVAAILQSSKHIGKIYELNGPEALNYAAVAARIAQIIGTPVKYVDIPPAQQAESMRQLGMPEWQIQALLALQRYYTEGGGAEADQVVANLLGQPPRKLNDYLKENADQFRRADVSA